MSNESENRKFIASYTPSNYNHEVVNSFREWLVGKDIIPLRDFPGHALELILQIAQTNTPDEVRYLFALTEKFLSTEATGQVAGSIPSEEMHRVRYAFVLAVFLAEDSSGIVAIEYQHGDKSGIVEINLSEGTHQLYTLNELWCRFVESRENGD